MSFKQSVGALAPSSTPIHCNTISHARCPALLPLAFLGSLQPSVCPLLAQHSALCTFRFMFIPRCTSEHLHDLHRPFRIRHLSASVIANAVQQEVSKAGSKWINGPRLSGSAAVTGQGVDIMLCVALGVFVLRHFRSPYSGTAGRRRWAAVLGVRHLWPLAALLAASDRISETVRSQLAPLATVGRRLPTAAAACCRSPSTERALPPAEHHAGLPGRQGRRRDAGQVRCACMLPAD